MGTNPDRQVRQTGRQADRRTSSWLAGRQVGSRTGRQAGRQAFRRAGRQAGRQTDRQAGRQAGEVNTGIQLSHDSRHLAVTTGHALTFFIFNVFLFSGVCSKNKRG